MTVVTRSMLRCMAVLALALASMPVLAGRPVYRIEAVAGSDDLHLQSAAAINRHGQIIGLGTGWRVSGIFTTTGEPIPIRRLAGSAQILPRALNDRGDIIGRKSCCPWEDTTVVWWKGQVRESLPIAGNDIDAAGRVAGSIAIDVDGTPHAALHDHGTLTDLGTLGGQHSVATRMNDDGAITGYASLADGSRHAFVWRNGTMTDLGTLAGDTHSRGTGINARGEVCGVSSVGGARILHPFVHDGTSMQRLPLYRSVNGDWTPVDINRHGEVVGNGNWRVGAVLYRRGKAWPLQELLDESGAAWRDLTAYAIKDDGVIVGEGRNLGNRWAFIATPVAESE